MDASDSSQAGSRGRISMRMAASPMLTMSTDCLTDWQNREGEERNDHNTYFSLAGAVLREVTEVECDWAWRSVWCAPPAPVDRSVGSDSRDRWAALAGETPWPPWPMDSEGR